MLNNFFPSMKCEVKRLLAFVGPEAIHTLWCGTLKVAVVAFGFLRIPCY